MCGHSLQRGYDEVDAAKLDNVALKVKTRAQTHAYTTLTRVFSILFPIFVLQYPPLQVSHALVGILRQRHLHDRCAAQRALTRCCIECLSAKSDEGLMRVVFRNAPAAFGADDISVWLPHSQHKDALWTSHAARSSAGKPETVHIEPGNSEETSEAGTADLSLLRDKFMIPFPEWLPADSGCVVIGSGSPNAQLQWAAEACSLCSKPVAGIAVVVCVLPLLAISGGKGGVLIFRFSGRRSQKDATVDREMAEQLRAAIVKTLHRVKEEDELLKGAEILERRLGQHEKFMQYIPQVRCFEYSCRSSNSFWRLLLSFRAG